MKKVYVVLLLLVVGILGAACSVSTANIQSATLGTGYDSANQKVTGETTTFAPTDTTLHAVISVANAPEDTSVRTVWTAVDVTDASGASIKDQKIDEATFMTKDIGSVIDATLTANAGNTWPTGKYKLDIYLNEKLDRTLEFSVSE